jgi:hypothetical protein
MILESHCPVWQATSNTAAMEIVLWECSDKTSNDSDSFRFDVVSERPFCWDRSSNDDEPRFDCSSSMNFLDAPTIYWTWCALREAKTVLLTRRGERNCAELPRGREPLDEWI